MAHPAAQEHEEGDSRNILLKKSLEDGLWDIIKRLTPLNRRPSEIKVNEAVGYIWCQTEVAAKNLRISWLEAAKTQEIILFDRKLSMRRARTSGDRAVTKLAMLLGAVAETFYGKQTARRWQTVQK